MSNKSTRLPFAERIIVTTVLLTLWLVALTTFGQTPPSNEPRELLPNQAFDREMIGAETHRYRISLNKDEFFQVRVEQKGVDVTLKLSDANGKVRATMDSPNGKQGPETFSFVAEQPGSFVLEVSAPDAKAEKGSYSIRREASRAATAKDRRRVEVERIFVAGMTALGVKGQEDTALKQLSEAQAGWEELADDYMTKLTAQQVITRGLNKDLQTAQGLLSEGQKLIAKSKSDSLPGKTKLNEALKAYRALEVKLSDRALVEKVSRLGAMSQQILNYLKAFQFFSKQGEALSLNGIAQADYNLGEWQEHAAYLKLSLVAYEDSIKFITDSNISGLNQKQILLALKAVEASALENLGGTLNNRLGKPDEALKYLNQALEQYKALYQETNDPKFKLQEAQTVGNIGLVYINASKDRKKGVDFLLKAIEIYRTFPDQKIQVASLLDLIGSQHALDFDYEAALKNWDDALEIHRELDDKFGQMGVLQSKGNMYFILDNKAKVKENFNQALSILQSPDFAENFRKTHLHHAAGFEIFNELNDAFIERTRLHWIGVAYERLEDYEKAIEYYEKTLAVARASKEPGDIRSESASVAFVYTKLGKWDKAYEYYKQVLEISRGRNLQENLADDLADVGWTLLESGKPQEALKYQNEALALYESVNVSAKNAFSLRYSPLLNELARTYDALGNRRMAVFYGKQGVNAIQDERRRLLRTFDAEAQKGFIGRKEKHYRRLADWLIAEGRIIEAEQVLELLKEEEILSYLRRDTSASDKLQNHTDLTPEEREALRRYNEIADKIAALGVEYGRLEELGGNRTAPQQKRYDELSKQINDANEGFQVFLKQLAEEFGKRSLTKENLNETFALQSKLKSWGEGVVFLYTLVGDDRYRVILITPEAQTRGKTEIKVKDLSEKITNFRQVIMNPRLDPRPLGKELYDILIRPIEKQLDDAGAKTLLWSLDGNLRLLPLAALWDGKQYFGQKYQNVTVTLASRDNLSDAVSPNWRVLALGVSEAKQVEVKELNETKVFQFPPLPAVITELRSIVQSKQSPNGVLPGQSLLDAEFNETALETQLSLGYKVIHIASHFKLNPGDVTRSFLLLGDGNVLTVSAMRNNSRLKLKGVELLTLSACETAVLEKDSSGKEIEGFGYVAQQKGAKAILATLWSVADESTQLLMSEFYRLRKENSQLTKAAALQLAQQEMIESKLQHPAVMQQKRSTLKITDAAMNAPAFPFDPKKPYAHPYYWAPFILIGNWK